MFFFSAVMFLVAAAVTMLAVAGESVAGELRLEACHQEPLSAPNKVAVGSPHPPPSIASTLFLPGVGRSALLRAGFGADDTGSAFCASMATPPGQLRPCLMLALSIDALHRRPLRLTPVQMGSASTGRVHPYTGLVRPCAVPFAKPTPPLRPLRRAQPRWRKPWQPASLPSNLGDEEDDYQHTVADNSTSACHAVMSGNDVFLLPRHYNLRRGLRRRLRSPRGKLGLGQHVVRMHGLALTRGVLRVQCMGDAPSCYFVFFAGYQGPQDRHLMTVPVSSMSSATHRARVLIDIDSHGCSDRSDSDAACLPLNVLPLRRASFAFHLRPGEFHTHQVSPTIL